MKLTKHETRIIILSSLTFVLDLVSKEYAKAAFRTPFDISSWLRLVYSENTGIAFGIPFTGNLLLLSNIILFVFILFLLAKKINKHSIFSGVAFGLLLGGALGNVLDRIFRGFVIDFIAIGNFPVFNLADSAITISIFIILLFYDRILGTKSKKHA